MGFPPSLGKFPVSKTTGNVQKVMLQELKLLDVFFFYCTSEENKRLVLREGFSLDSIGIILCPSDADNQKSFYVYRGAEYFVVHIPDDIVHIPDEFESNRDRQVNEMIIIEGIEFDISRTSKGFRVNRRAQHETTLFFMELLKMIFHASHIYILHYIQIKRENPNRVYVLECLHPYIESTFEFEFMSPSYFPIGLETFREFNADGKDDISKIIHETRQSRIRLFGSTEADANFIIKWFLQTDGLNMKKMTIELTQYSETSEARMDRHMVLRDLPIYPVSEKESSDHYDENVEYEDEFEVKKFDDDVITIIFDENGRDVILMVRNTSQPDCIEPVEAERVVYVKPIVEEAVDNEPEDELEDETENELEDELENKEPMSFDEDFWTSPLLDYIYF